MSAPLEKLILRGTAWACVDCGAELEAQDDDGSGRDIAWVTHKSGCPTWRKSR